MSYSVLLVEDDPVVLRTLKAVFESRNFDVSTALSARDAIPAMSQRLYDLIVTDMRMETDTAGYDVVRCAKSQATKPVVAILSAFPIPSTEWRDAGADAMFLKGGGVMRMLDDVERILSARGVAERKLSPSPAAAEHKKVS